MNDPTDLTKRCRKSLGENFLHGWEIPGPQSPDGAKITLLPNSPRYVSGRVAMFSWRISDGRGELVFSVCLNAGWARGNTEFRLAAYRGSLGPADFPEWFERSDDWWRVHAAVVGRLPANAEADALA